jgi:hypothetical protein
VIICSNCAVREVWFRASLNDDCAVTNMKAFEYKTVTYQSGVMKQIFSDAVGRCVGTDFVDVLNRNGRDGWDLKAVIVERSSNILLIFGREIDQESPKSA